jgi:ferredoxin--NADP+ reductase
MKDGLRMMFKRILQRDGVHYYGNVKVGEDEDVTLEQLRDVGFDAYVFAVGAQGTRKLGLPNEDAEGVHHAKDLVYHYNSLPPFSERDYKIGDHAVVIGLGNVCLDMVHYFSCEEKIDSVTAVGRRGPEERKMTDRELKIVSGALDIDQIEHEFERITPYLTAVNQDPDASFEDLTKYRDEPLEVDSPTDFRFRFLLSPKAVEADDTGHVKGVTFEKNRLIETDEGTIGFEGLGETETLQCDTLVFAVGDRIESGLGLPLDSSGQGFATVPISWDEHPKRPRYMVYDPDTGTPVWDTFVIGWAREASEGVVGKAKKDAETGCDEILGYIDGSFNIEPDFETDEEAVRESLEKLFDNRNLAIVSFEQVLKIEEREQQLAEKQERNEFKFKSNQRMLEAIGAE